MELIKLENVNKSFGKRHILKDISATINSASIVTFTGKSGSGKSTLLGIISGMLKPDKGKVLFKGKNIARWWDLKKARFRRREMGFVFQFFSLFPEMNAYENIMYPAVLNPFASRKKALLIDDLIELLQLKEIITQYPSTLSGGERQRVAIARSIINGPGLILADEPTGNLDQETARQIISLFQTLRDEKGITTIIATHDEELVKSSDVSFHLDSGIITENNPARKEETTRIKTKEKAVKKKTSKKKSNTASKKTSTKKAKTSSKKKAAAKKKTSAGKKN